MTYRQLEEIVSLVNKADTHYAWAPHKTELTLTINKSSYDELNKSIQEQFDSSEFKISSKVSNNLEIDKIDVMSIKIFGIQINIKKKEVIYGSHN